MSNEFALDFVNWFYPLLNSAQQQLLNSSIQHGASLEGRAIKQEMFFENATMEAFMVEGSSTKEFSAKGDSGCVSLIENILQESRLLFSPNLEGGVQVRKSKHGLIQLFCCGTLHVQSNFVGIFEQEFGLACSPQDKSWKIAYNKVNLKNQNVTAIPSIPKEEIFAIEY